MQKTTALCKKLWPRYVAKLSVYFNVPFMMKVSTCVFLVITLSAQLLFAKKTFGQQLEDKKVTMELHNETLATAFKKLEQLSGFHFAYPPELVAKYKNISISKASRSVAATLDELLAATGLTYSQVENDVVISARTNKKLDNTQSATPMLVLQADETITIRGVVANAAGDPLPGASIAVKGTRLQKTTNGKGEYEIAGVGNNALLSITYIGYEPLEVAVNGKNIVNIILKPEARELDNVNVGTVSNGYQSVAKERATGSFGTITAKEIQQTPSTNLYDKLEGKIAGVMINNRRNVSSNTTGTSPITIRGRTSYSTGANAVNPSPLVVIDGFPYYQYSGEDILNTLNPDDVEQIDFLKDAAAASIWGAQASNGVIVVTTKKGKKNSKANISFSTTLSITGKARLETMNQMTSAEYLDLEQEMVTKGIATDPYSFSSAPNGSQGKNLFFQYKRGLITAAQRDSGVAALSKIDNLSQIKKYLLQNPAIQQYNLSVSGGSDNNTYYVSGYYYTDRPTYKSNANKGWNITANNSYLLFNKRLTFNTGISYIGNKNQSNSSAVNTLGNSTLGFERYDNLVDDNGNPVQYAVAYTPAVLSSYESKGYLNWRYSPITELNYSNTINNINTIRVTAGLNGKITSWLNAEVSGNMERKFSESVTYNEPNSYTSRQLVNFGTSISSTGVLVYGVPKGGVLYTNTNNGKIFNLRGQFTANKTWKGVHNINAVGGAEMRELNSKVAQTFLYGYDATLGSNAAYNQVATYTNAIGGTGQIGNSNTNQNITHRWISYYGNASYTYLNRYIASGSIRFDDADVVGLNRRKRARPFWSTGVKWDLLKESFMRKASWINALSVRATYGFNGAVPQNGTTLPIISVATTADFNTGLNYATISTPANPNLGWEKTKVTNYGADFSVLDRRLYGSVEFYTKSTTDIIYSMPINATYGMGNAFYNTGNMKGHGWDIKLSGVPLRGKNFSWTSTLVFSYNTNKVTDSRLSSLAIANITSGSPYTGYPLDYLFVYRWAGLDSTGQSQVYAADGKTKLGKTTNITDVNALKYAGRTSSPYFGGFNNTFTYKQFQLSVQMNYYLGSVFLRPSLDNYPVGASYGTSYIGKQKDLAYRWRQKGDELTTNVPGLTGINSNSSLRYKTSDLLVTNGSYVRLQQIALSYGFPNKWFSRLAINNLNISGTVRDLGIIWRGNKQGLDPQYQRSSSSVNDNILPSVNYAIRLSANF